ncbi:Transcriptional regulator, AraC family [Mucinivorans hirudinis]|uniref:Transcriptional regulator, AraC family n=1 Tax=Mucinivorans hirudinis TaxID=1433126 RepID=A0A060R8R5_9BACT|nr:Transcriptional regulator, AraC family [Mucinivorans hirudinis]
MKVCNTTACQTCHSNDKQSFKLLVFPCGRIAPPKKVADRLLFVLSGRLSVKADGQDEFFCDKDEIILLVRDKKYEVTVLEDTKLLVLTFATTYQICDKMGLRDAKHILDATRYKFHSLPIREPMKLILESVLYYLRDNITCGHWQKAKFLEFFVVYWNYYTLEEICHFFYPVINKDIGFHAKVMANCTKAKTVKELARLCGYSLTPFNKLFLEHFQHSSPYKWMLQQNAPLIKARLLDKTVPIKAIAAEFGFTDQTHLNRYCKRYFNTTALQIRNRND